MPFICPNCRHEFEAPARPEGRSCCPACGAELPESGKARGGNGRYAQLGPGDVLGGFRLEEVLGAGAMAIVYRATQLSLNRTVALKMLPERYADMVTFVERFDKESSALAALNHPSIVSIIDRGRRGRTYYFAMEYIEGRPLEQKLVENVLPSELVGIIKQVCSALEYAHSRGVVHRDIKPSNIMLTDRGDVKIADFGLAGLMTEGQQAKATDRPPPRAMGTRGYMAPEQVVDPLDVDGRADLYAFGVVLYQALAGKLPGFPVAPPSSLNEAADPRLDPVVMRCLAPDREQRYPDASALLKDILAYEQELLHAPDCPKCGAENPVRVQQCRHCGASLEGLFDLCPKCGAENRDDVGRCLSCDVDLKQAREAVNARIAELTDQVNAHEGREEFDLALGSLRKLCGIRGKAFEETRRSAGAATERIRKRRYEAAMRDVNEGNRLFQLNKIDEALTLWRRVPTGVVDLTDTIRQTEEWKRELDSVDEVRRSAVLAAKPVVARLPAAEGVARQAIRRKLIPVGVALLVLAAVALPVANHFVRRSRERQRELGQRLQRERRQAAGIAAQLPPAPSFHDYVLPLDDGWRTLSPHVKWGLSGGSLANATEAPHARCRYDEMAFEVYDLSAEVTPHADAALGSGGLALYARYSDADSCVRLALAPDGEGRLIPELEVRNGGRSVHGKLIGEPMKPKATGPYKMAIAIRGTEIIGLIDGEPAARARAEQLPGAGWIALEAHNVVALWQNITVTFRPELETIGTADVVREPGGAVVLDGPGGFSIGPRPLKPCELSATMEILEQQGSSAELWLRRFHTQDRHVQVHLTRNAGGKCRAKLEANFPDPDTWETVTWQQEPVDFELPDKGRHTVRLRFTEGTVSCVIGDTALEAELPPAPRGFYGGIRIESRGIRTRWEDIRVHCR